MLDFTVTNILSFVVGLALLVGVFRLAGVYANSVGRPVLMGRMLSRHGASLDKVSSDGLDEEFANRARVCSFCQTYNECRCRLEAEDAPKYSDICPNATFIKRLAS